MVFRTYLYDVGHVVYLEVSLHHGGALDLPRLVVLGKVVGLEEPVVDPDRSEELLHRVLHGDGEVRAGDVAPIVFVVDDTGQLEVTEDPLDDA